MKDVWMFCFFFVHLNTSALENSWLSCAASASKKPLSLVGLVNDGLADRLRLSALLSFSSFGAGTDALLTIFIRIFSKSRYFSLFYTDTDNVLFIL